jgi:hypothetical protein
MPNPEALASLLGKGSEGASSTGPRKKLDDKDKKKHARKAERDARKKARRK